MNARMLLLFLSIALLWSTSALADDSPSYPPIYWPHERPTALTVSLESNRTIFTPGQAVLVRITLANHSDVGIKLNFGNAWDMFLLKITDGRGDIVKPNITPSPKVISYYLGRPGPLWPGETFVVAGETQDRFSSLEAWGYQLNQPGTYRITAFQNFGNGAEVDSNTLTIDVR